MLILNSMPVRSATATSVVSMGFVPASFVVSMRGAVIVAVTPVVAAAGLKSTSGPVVSGITIVINVAWRSRWTVMASPVGS
jgi:hypothetical protein